MIYCQGIAMVDKILYLAIKAGVHIIDTYVPTYMFTWYIILR